MSYVGKMHQDHAKSCAGKRGWSPTLGTRRTTALQHRIELFTKNSLFESINILLHSSLAFTFESHAVRVLAVRRKLGSTNPPFAEARTWPRLKAQNIH